MGNEGSLTGSLAEPDEADPKRWYGHDAIIALRKPYEDAHEPENIVIGCTGCGWRSSEESFSSSGFAVHLSDLDAPDYMVKYWACWADHVEVPFGQLDRDAVARELSDFSMVMDCASAVFNELADLSKPHTRPDVILAENERRMAENYALMLCGQAYERLEEGELRAAIAMIQVADGWHPGAWRSFADDRRHWAEVAPRLMD